MAIQTWKVTIAADSHNHARALAAEAEGVEAKDGTKRATVLALDAKRIIFELDVSASHAAPVTARVVTEWVQEHVVRPTANRYEVGKSHPAVELLNGR